MTWEEASLKYNFIKIGTDGVPEIYADNHMLSHLRKCEAYFMESIVNRHGTKVRSWALEFGQWLHYVLEMYYDSHAKDNFNLATWLVTINASWKKADLDYFTNSKQYKTLGGLPGAIQLCTEYYACFGNGKESLQTVGLEIAFGKDKEVPILDDHTKYSYAPFRAYLSGRMDRIVDDGKIIYPLDNKSKGYFDGSESTMYILNDGLTGYVYALRCIMDKLFPNLKAQGRLCDRIIVNHISVKKESVPAARFKRSILTKTEAQLEEYRQRQIATFSQIYQLLILERPSQWVTEHCDNWYYHDCPFKSIHEQDPIIRENIIKQNYIQIEEWSPYVPSNK